MSLFQWPAQLARTPHLCKVREIIKMSLRLGAQGMFRKAARILIAVWLIATAQAALAEKRVALVIGNSAYTFSDPLENPRNDADDITAALQRLNFDVKERKDLTVREFDQAIDAFEAAEKNADVRS